MKRTTSTTGYDKHFDELAISGVILVILSFHVLLKSVTKHTISNFKDFETF